MSQVTENTSRPESLEVSDESSLNTLQSTRCGHLAKAAELLEWATKNRLYEPAMSQATAKLAELHIMLADRVSMLDECGADDE